MVSQTINDLYYVVAVNSVTLPASEPLLAIGAAVAVALLAAAAPALEAVHSTPQLTLRSSVLEGRVRRIAALFLGVSVLLAVGCGLIVLVSERSVVAGFAALVLAMLSVAAATPALLYACARGLARSRLAAAPPVRLALGGIAGSLSRTGVAVAALAMAVAAMIGISIMVDSFRESLRDWLSRTLQADIYVGAPGPGFARPERRLDAAVVADLVRVPGVARYSSSRRAVVNSDRGPVILDALDVTPLLRGGVDLIAAAPDVWQRFAAGEVLLAQPLAYRLDLGVGGSLRLMTAQGLRSFRVAGVFREYGNDRGSLRISRSVYRQLWGDASVSALALNVAPGTAVSAVVARLYAAAAGRQSLQVDTPAEVRAISLTIFERTFLITRVLNWLASGVAAVGLLSALLAWQLGRTRELALLRVLGLTRAGAAVMIEAQTLFMGAVAVLAALPAGVLTAILLVRVINRRAFGWQIDLHLHPAQLAGAITLALLAALLAGVYPAWRTAHAPLVQDLREE
jgi:putative ABC transport system permease protein